MKTFVCAATAVLPLILSAAISVSCNKDETGQTPSRGDGQNEIAVRSVVTKGYVTGKDFYDTPYLEIHSAEPSTAARTLQMSAYVVPQSGESGNYFIGETFEIGDKVGDKDAWHHTPALYWPVGGTLNFLPYSALIPFDAKDVAWGETDASASVVLQVLEDRTQDDILFGCASGASSTGAAPVGMTFQHAQAWIEFQIKMKDASMDGKLAVKEIVVENIYNGGELSITRNASTATAGWSFRKETAKNIVFEDKFGVYGSAGNSENDYAVSNPITSEVAYLDMLLPEQAKTAFVLKYVLAGQDKVLQYRFSLDGSNWTMGEKYVYQIEFSVGEITIAPSVTEYTANGDVSDLSGTLL